MFEKRAKQYLREKNARSNATNASVNAHRQSRLEKRAESQHIRAKIKALDKLSGVINDMQKWELQNRSYLLCKPNTSN